MVTIYDMSKICVITKEDPTLTQNASARINGMLSAICIFLYHLLFLKTFLNILGGASINTYHMTIT